MRELLPILLIFTFACNSDQDALKSNELVHLSAESYKNGEYDKALEFAQKAANLNDENYVAYVNQAAAYDKMDCTIHFTEPILLKAYDINPKYTVTLNSLIAVNNDNQRYNVASKYSEELLNILHLDSINYRTLNLIGKVFKNIGEDSRALKTLEASMKKDSTYVFPYIHAIEINLRNKQYDQAFQLLQIANKLVPNSSIQNLFGAYYYSMKDYQTAIKHVDKAIELESSLIFTANKALYLIKNGSILEGCRLFDKVETEGLDLEFDIGPNSEHLKVKHKYCRKTEANIV